MSDRRYCYRTDDDGHEYLVPVDVVDEFEAHLREIYEEEAWDLIDKVNQYRIDGIHMYTFTDPQED